MDLQLWLTAYTAAVEAAFGSRIVCLGLQGSQARGEAGPDSDIDAVLILDRLAPADLRRYRDAAAALPCREKLCGFVSGRAELLAWDRADLLSFCFDTRPLIGSLDFLRGAFRPADAARAVLTGACSLYHACAHTLVHQPDPAALPGLQKALFFTLRVRHFYRTGDFLRKKSQLLPLLTPAERALLAPGGFDETMDALLLWASQAIEEFGGETPCMTS